MCLVKCLITRALLGDQHQVSQGTRHFDWRGCMSGLLETLIKGFLNVDLYLIARKYQEHLFKYSERI